LAAAAEFLVFGAALPAAGFAYSVAPLLAAASVLAFALAFFF